MIFFDLEVTNLDYGSALNPDNRVVMVSWAVDDGPVKCYTGDLLDAKEFWIDFHNQEHVCAYNAKFEQHWIKRMGADIHDKQWHDPMLAEYVLRGNQRGSGLSLDKVARAYGEDTKDVIIDTLMQAGVCPSEMPEDRLRARNRRDVRVMREIYRKQRRRLAERKQLAVYRTRVDLTPVLTEIERSGMLLDPERVRQEYESYVGRKAALDKSLDQLTGGINLRSTDQLAEFLYEKLGFPERKGARGKLRNKPSKRWPEGKPKTDKATLAWLATQAKSKEQKEFIQLRSEYGKVNAALSKNLEFFQGVCQYHSGLFRAVLNQAVTATHRLSSSGLKIEIPGLGRRGVQFQNMPRDFKKLFTAPPGYFIVEADFPQLEFRTAAFLGQDAQALEDIQNPNFDAHVKSASVMNEQNYTVLFDDYKAGKKYAKQLRQNAKPDTFKPLYGGTKGTPAQERWYKEFQSRYSGVYSTQEGWLAEVMTSPEGELVLPWGMRFKWNFKTNRHGTAIDPNTGKPIGPAVFNYPVQSLATAEIVPIALICLFRQVRQTGLDVTFVNTVHDSVIAIVREDQIAEYNALVMACFTDEVYIYLWEQYGLEFRVPLGVEITYGKHWGAGKTIKYDDVISGGHLSWQKE